MLATQLAKIASQLPFWYSEWVAVAHLFKSRLFLFLVVFLLSGGSVALAVIYTSPTDDNGNLVIQYLVLLFSLIFIAFFSLLTLVLTWIHRFYEYRFRRKALSDSALVNRKALLTSMRRALLLSIGVIGSLVMKVFEINNALNISLLLVLLFLIEILIWRYYSR